MSEIIEGGPNGKSYNLKKYELEERIALFKKRVHWVFVVILCIIGISTKVFDWGSIWFVLTVVVWGAVINVVPSQFEMSNQVDYDHLVKLSKGLKKKIFQQETERLGLYSRRLKFKKIGLDLGSNKQEILLMREIEGSITKYTILMREIEDLLIEEVGYIG